MKRNKTIRKHYLVFVALAAAFATSCSTDDLTEQEQRPTEGKTMTLTASMDENQTRVGMTKDGTTAKFYWHKDDKILVQTKKSDGTFSGTEFTTTETATGAASATFTGKVSGTVGQYAVFPYNENHKFTDDKTLTYHLPNSYTYTTVESNIFSNGSTYPTNNTNMPMLGIIANGKISFTHLAGLAVIRIDKMPAESGTLTVTADKQISGAFAVNLSADTPAIATASTDTDADKQVVFTFSGATKGGVGVFYLPLATGTYSEIKLVIGNGVTTWAVDYGALSIDRADVTAISILYDSGVYYAKHTDGNYRINGHTFIDLGLPSGLLWATTNVGATSATDYGKYYAWGEITAYGEATDWGDKSAKTTYTDGTYKYYITITEMSKYNATDNRTALEAKDDVVMANWGLPCRMPTNTDIEELVNNCNWEWKTINDVSGVKVSSKTNDNSIFLPATGRRIGTDYEYESQTGCYWSRSLYSDNGYAYYLKSYNNFHFCTYATRCVGMAVRPVAEKSSTVINDQSVDDMDMNGFDSTWK